MESQTENLLQKLAEIAFTIDKDVAK